MKNEGYQKLIATINEITKAGERRKLGMLYTEDEILNGRNIRLRGKDMINFGSCGYLGLEQDSRLKKAAIDAVQRYGTYYSSSRTFVSCGNYSELEELVRTMYGTDIILTTNLTLGHHVVMPIVVESNDLVIYDQQAHISMHEISYKLKHFGTDITILRHNRIDELEKKIEENKGKYEKIWYVVDGVFSMFGDLPETKKLENLLNKYKQFYLYIDDAHGMSWAGPKGTGYTLSQINLHPRMILATSFAKGFGSCGGVFAIKDHDMYERVKRWGGPLTYSGPQEPATVGAAIASAKIHLSDEIYDLQGKLSEKIEFCNEVMQEYNIPLVSISNSPIFFVGVGITKLSFNMVDRLMREGYYTNSGAFPAVPETCNGVRFTITNHITKDDIANLAKTMARNIPSALQEEGRTIKHIFRAFRKFSDMEHRIGDAYDKIDFIKEDSLVLETFKSVQEIGKENWDKYMENRGSFAYDNLVLLENVFQNNDKPENNWDFYYFQIKDATGNIILQTFFTCALSKDDMIAPDFVSGIIEEERQNNPYYLTSRYFLMGTLITNGQHLYLNTDHQNWKRAMVKLIDHTWQLQDATNSNVVYFRDFESNNREINELFLEYGFVKIDLPENHVIRNDKHQSIETFIKDLSSKKRQYLKKDVLLKENEFKIDFNSVNHKNLPELYELYCGIQKSKLNLNTFALPYSFFEAIIKSDHWEVMQIKLKNNPKVVAVVFSTLSDTTYSPVIVGIDKTIPEDQQLYRQLLYQLIKRGLDLKLNNLWFGLTASIAKRKMGISAIPQVGFIQVKDHYNMDYIENLKFSKA